MIEITFNYLAELSKICYVSERVVRQLVRKRKKEKKNKMKRNNMRRNNMEKKRNKFCSAEPELCWAAITLARVSCSLPRVRLRVLVQHHALLRTSGSFCSDRTTLIVLDLTSLYNLLCTSCRHGMMQHGAYHEQARLTRSCTWTQQTPGLQSSSAQTQSHCTYVHTTPEVMSKASSNSLAHPHLQTLALHAWIQTVCKGLSLCNPLASNVNGRCRCLPLARA